jgi:hypothetical protein
MIISLCQNYIIHSFFLIEEVAIKELRECLSLTLTQIDALRNSTLGTHVHLKSYSLDEILIVNVIAVFFDINLFIT